jgi:large-conductance mechanosensitive channel
MATKKNTPTNTKSKKKSSPVTRKPGESVEVVVSADIKGTTGRGRKPNVRVLLDTNDLVREEVSGFVDFVREHAIVGLAVGFVIGQQAQGIIKQLISSFIDPAFQLFFGEKLTSRTFTLHFSDRSADFGWGGMVHVLLNLVFVLAAIYIILKVFKLDKLDKKKEN